jgi:hypothetical protein
MWCDEICRALPKGTRGLNKTKEALNVQSLLGFRNGQKILDQLQVSVSQ